MKPNDEQEEEELQISILSNPVMLISTIASAFDIYCVLSGIYWVSVISFPESYLLSLEIIAEFIFLLNLTLEYQMTSNNNSEEDQQPTTRLNFSQKMRIFLIRISVVPIVFVLMIINTFAHFPLANGKFSLIFLIKILRVLEAVTFISRIAKIVIYSNFMYLVYFKIIENIFIMVALNHFGTCLWLLVNKIDMMNGGKRNYFSRMEQSNQADNYVDSLMWAVSTMNGGSFGDVTPLTSLEYIASITFMLIGGTFYAKIFSDFEKIVYIREREKIEKNKLFDEAKLFCVENKVSFDSRKKLRDFFTTKINGYYESKNWDALQQFPISLKTEISLHLNEKMIKEVKLFKMSTPSFLLALSKY